MLRASWVQTGQPCPSYLWTRTLRVPGCLLFHVFVLDHFLLLSSTVLRRQPSGISAVEGQTQSLQACCSAVSMPGSWIHLLIQPGFRQPKRGHLHAKAKDLGEVLSCTAAFRRSRCTNAFWAAMRAAWFRWKRADGSSESSNTPMFPASSRSVILPGHLGFLPNTHWDGLYPLTLLMRFLVLRASCEQILKSLSPVSASATTRLRIAFITPCALSTFPMAEGVSNGAKITSQPWEAKSLCTSPRLCIPLSQVTCFGQPAQLTQRLTMASAQCSDVGIPPPTLTTSAKWNPVAMSTKLSMEYLLPASSLASATSIPTPTQALNSNWNLGPTGCSLGRGLASSQTVHLTGRALSINSAGALPAFKIALRV